MPYPSVTRLSCTQDTTRAEPVSSPILLTPVLQHRVWNRFTRSGRFRDRQVQRGCIHRRVCLQPVMHCRGKSRTALEQHSLSGRSLLFPHQFIPRCLATGCNRKHRGNKQRMDREVKQELSHPPQVARSLRYGSCPSFSESMGDATGHSMARSASSHRMPPSAWGA